MKNPKLLFLAAILIGLLGATYFVNRVRRDNSQDQIIEENGSQIAIEDVEGLPSNFPEDFPIYPGATIEESFISRDAEIEALSVVWMTTDSVEQVGEYFDNELGNSGWSVEYTSGDDESVVFSFSKGEVGGFAGIGKTEDNTVVISVTLGADFANPSM